MKTSNKLLLGLLVFVILVITVFILLIGLTSASYANSAQSPDETLVGTWVGETKPIVLWVNAKSIPVKIVIQPSGEITGMLGDATIVKGIMKNRHNSIMGKFLNHRGFSIIVELQGKIIDAEQIHRRSANIFFIDYKDGEWYGSFHTSGTDIGGKNAMVLTTTDMVLRKTEEITHSEL
jgi:hypothetical protein